MSKPNPARNTGVAARINKTHLPDEASIPKQSTAPISVPANGTIPADSGRVPITTAEDNETPPGDSPVSTGTDFRNMKAEPDTAGQPKRDMENFIFGRPLTEKEELVAELTKALMPAVAQAFPGFINAGQWDQVVQTARGAAISYISHFQFKAFETKPEAIPGRESTPLPYGICMAGGRFNHNR